MQYRALNFLTQTARDCDAMCTQESGTRLTLQSYISTTPNFASADAYQDDPCALVTTTAQRVQKTMDLPIKAGLNWNRSALLVQLRSGLVVVNVHLTSGNPGRARAELRDIIDNYLTKYYANASWLIIGDFNHDPRDDYPNLNIVAGPDHQNGSVLDWAMSNVGIVAHAYPRYHGSDHGPWYVEVNV